MDIPVEALLHLLKIVMVMSWKVTADQDGQRSCSMGEKDRATTRFYKRCMVHCKICMETFGEKELEPTLRKQGTAQGGMCQGEG